jgi:hypothetical protein
MVKVMNQMMLTFAEKQRLAKDLNRLLDKKRNKRKVVETTSTSTPTPEVVHPESTGALVV